MLQPVFFLIRQLWTYSQGRRHFVVLYLFMAVIAKTLFLLEPLIIGHILNTIQTLGLTQDSMPKIFFWLALMLAIPFMGTLLHGPSRILEICNSFHVSANFKKYLLKGTLDLPLAWHAEHHSGATIDKIEKGAEGLREFAWSGFAVINILISVPIALFALAYFYLPALFIALTLATIMLFVVIGFDSKVMVLLRKIHDQENMISGRVYDAVSNVTTIVILRIERLMHNSLVKSIFSPYPDVKRNTILNETKWSLVGLLNMFMIVTVLGAYIFSIYRSEETLMIGTLVILYGYSQQVQNRIFEMTWRYSEIVRQRTTVQNALDLAADFRMKTHSKGARIGDWSRLEIKNLTFSYHGEDGDRHLDKISLDIYRGKRIALIGSSGSGKTTFLKVFRELYSADVHLLVDSKPLSGFDAIAEDVSLIPQDPEIFNTTIEENVTCGIDHTHSEVLRYANLACATEFIEALPNGWASRVNEKGVNLSGGQKQRLALARGLLASKNKEFVLMDEPTSSVDSKNELAIYKNVFAAFPDKTILSSIHRLHLLPLFDVVYYFEDGHIVAHGTFEDLKHSSTKFQELWRKYEDASEH